MSKLGKRPREDIKVEESPVLCTDGVVRRLLTKGALRAVGATVMVTAIHRYLPDAEYERTTGLRVDNVAYDIEIADRTNTLKCLLGPTVYPSVETLAVMPGTMVTIDALAVVETPKAEYVVLLEALTAVAPAPLGALPAAAALPPHEFTPSSCLNDVPMLCHRSFYLPMWCEDVMENIPAWRSKNKPLVVNSEFVVPRGMGSIADVVAGSKVSRKLAVAPTVAGAGAAPDEWVGFNEPHGDARLAVVDSSYIVGRLVSVARIVHFGSPAKQHKTPFMFTFRIKDASQTIDVVAWMMTAAWFHRSLRSLVPGTLLKVSGFNIKRNKLTGYMEASLNSTSKPLPGVEVLPEESLRDFGSDGELQFPRPALRFMRTVEALSLQDGAGFSFSGVVVRAGPILRTPAAGSHMEDLVPGVPSTTFTGMEASSGPFYEYRWIEVCDTEALVSLPIMLFRNSRTRRFERIAPCTAVAITFLRMVAAQGSPRPMYAVSSDHTSVLTGSKLKSLAAFTPSVASAVEWAASDMTEEFLLSRVKGNVLTHAGSAALFSKLVSRAPVPVVPMSDLATLKKYVRWGELRHILVPVQLYGFIHPPDVGFEDDDSVDAAPTAKVKGDGRQPSVKRQAARESPVRSLVDTGAEDAKPEPADGTAAAAESSDSDVSDADVAHIRGIGLWLMDATSSAKMAVAPCTATPFATAVPLPTQHLIWEHFAPLSCQFPPEALATEDGSPPQLEGLLAWAGERVFHAALAVHRVAADDVEVTLEALFLGPEVAAAPP